MNYQNTTIDLLRHGEPEGGRMYRGSGTDHPLSELGWQEMQQSIKKRMDVSDTNWSHIITSPMIRCSVYAQELSQQLKIPLEIVDTLVEANYGEWEGKTPRQIKEEFGEEYWEFYADPVNKRPREAESLEALNDRVATSLADIIHRYKGQKVLLISHAGVMRAVMGTVLNMPLASQQKINIPYAGMYRVLDEIRGTRICFF